MHFILLHSVACRISWPGSTHYSEIVPGEIKGEGELDGVTREVGVRLREEGIMRRVLREKRERERSKKKSERVMKREGAHLCGKGICALKPNAEVRKKLMWKLKKESRREEGWGEDHWKPDSKRETGREKEKVEVTDFLSVWENNSAAGVNLVSARRSEAGA